MELSAKLNLEDVMKASNVVDLLSEDDCKKIGEQVSKDFEVDMSSRSSWEKRTEASMKLALQVAEAKNFPWPNSSNIKFPLVTIAALQYHARAYPVLINGDTPIKCRVIGEDTAGDKTKRAERIETHMSYQILEEDEAWESEMDKALLVQPIIGCAFKKTFFDPIKNINISETVSAKDFVVNYWTKTLDTCPRCTHILYFSHNDIYERVARKLWADVFDRLPQLVNASNLSLARDKSQGITPPETVDHSTPYEILEQHRSLDLDGDGYEEPYVVWVRRDTKKVARIVARFTSSSIEYEDKKKKDVVLSISGEQYFTKYPFIPSPDGGFYDLGFGILLGPLNESINTIINQLVDAGTMANTAGGFLSRGIKLRGGNYSFNPLEWKHVDTTGDDLRKGIVPLPVREPSQVLLALLSLLINYGERIGGSVDILTGQNPGQNTPAETTRTMAEQGMKVFNGIFKRTYRSLKDEFRKLYRLNQLHLLENKEFVTEANNKGTILVDDYNGDSSDVRPSADPSITSDTQRLTQAQMMRQAAAEVPIYDKYQVERKYLKALKVDNIEQVLPDPKGPNAIKPPMTAVMVKLEVEKLKQQGKQAEDQLNLKLGLLKLMKEAELGQAKIHKLEAEAAVLMKEAQNADSAHRLNQINTAVGLAKERREGIMSSVETMLKVAETMKAGQESSSEGEAKPA